MDFLDTEGSVYILFDFSQPRGRSMTLNMDTMPDGEVAALIVVCAMALRQRGRDDRMRVELWDEYGNITKHELLGAGLDKEVSGAAVIIGNNKVETVDRAEITHEH